MQPVARLTSHNARLAHIRKFVMVPPERGRMLRLVTCEEPPAVIGEWTREQCADNATTPVDVDELLREHTQTMQSETIATLAWQSAENTVVTSKRLKCAYEAEVLDPSLAAQTEALGINGTAQGATMQTQVALERLVRLFMTGSQANQQTQLGLISSLGGMVQSSWAENRKLQAELDSARAKQRSEIDQLVEALRDVGGEAPDPEKEVKAEILSELGGQLAKVLPHLVVHFLQQRAQQPSNTNAQPAPQDADVNDGDEE